MPRSKRDPAVVEAASTVAILPAWLDELEKGPMSATAVQATALAFKKALIGRAMGAELSHYLGYRAGEPPPAGRAAPGRACPDFCVRAILTLRRLYAQVSDAAPAGPAALAALLGNGRRADRADALFRQTRHAMLEHALGVEIMRHRDDRPRCRGRDAGEREERGHPEEGASQGLDNHHRRSEGWGGELPYPDPFKCTLVARPSSHPA
jgi:hypothetical protein